MLEAPHRGGAADYSAQRDWEYRRLRKRPVALLRRTPGLKGLTEWTHPCPPALANECDEVHQMKWDMTG